MIRSRSALTIVGSISLLVASLIAGCSGGGGGSPGAGSSSSSSSSGGGPTISGNGFAPTSGPGDTQSYFPVAAGDQWIYNSTTNDSTSTAPTDTDSVSVNGTKQLLGITGTTLTEQLASTPSSSIDNYYFVSPGGVTVLGNTDPTDTVTPSIAPYVQLLFPVQTGSVSSLTGTNLSGGTDTAGNPLTINVTQSVQNSDVEAVSTPAGNFPNAMKQVTTVSATANDAALGKTFTLGGTDTTWLVPGVGIVQDTEVIPATGATASSTTTKVLRGYTVNGVQHGLGSPGVVGVAVPIASGLPPRSVALGYDGQEFLLAYQQISGSSPNYTATWTLAVLSANGGATSVTPMPTSQPLQSVATVAAVASSGSNFLFAASLPSTTLQASLTSIATTLFAADGSIVPALVTVASNGANYPALAFDGSHYLLVYESSTAPGVGQLFGQFISAQNGQTTAAAFPILAVGGYKSNLTLAFDGTNYVVAWADTGAIGGNPSNVPAIAGVYAVRVSPAGTVIDTAPIAIAQQSQTSSCCSVGGPVIAFDGTNYLVAYVDSRGSVGNSSTISAARLSTAGTLLDGTAATPGITVTTTTTVGSGSLALAYVGGDYWLSWVESLSPSVIDGLYGARVSTSGQVMSPGAGGFRMAPAGTVFYPSMAGNAGGGLLAWLWGDGPQAPAAANSIGTVTVHAAGP